MTEREGPLGMRWVSPSESEAIQRLYDAARAVIQRFAPAQYDANCECEWCMVGVALDALRDLCGEEA